MNDLEFNQMREREQAVIERLNRKLKGAPDLSKLSGQLKIVSGRLNKDELWVMRDIVNEAIAFIEQVESSSSTQDKHKPEVDSAIKFTESEIKRMQESPEALQIAMDIHDCWICEGEAMGFDTSGNEKRKEELRIQRDRLIAEI